jgi:hypothetical protein
VWYTATYKKNKGDKWKNALGDCPHDIDEMGDDFEKVLGKLKAI